MSDPDLRRVAVLLAGGVGARMGGSTPKQLIEIAGRTILEHSLAALHGHPMVDEIRIVMAPGHLEAARALVRTGGYDRVVEVLEGGRTRSESTLRALASIGHEECLVLLHDAARPLVSPRLITESFEQLRDYPAVTVAIASSDTIIEVGADETVASIPPRASLRRVQTPQAFRCSVLRRAYELAVADPGFTATDDCGVVRRYLPDQPIRVVEGDERNLKVTDPIDVAVVERLLAADD